MLTRAWHALKSLSLGRYTCIVCNHRIRDFEPLPKYYHEKAAQFGYKPSFDDAETLNYKQYFCPSCGVSDRDRLYALFISKYLSENNVAKMTMLEIAPSKALSKFIKKTGRINLRTADLYMQEVDDKIDITNMQNYANSSFDSFICSHVLEHVADDRKALSELYRILKPGGWGILMVPIILGIDAIDEDPTLKDEGERWRRFGQNDHVRRYSKKGFLDRVEAAGFRVYQYGSEYFGAEVFQKNAINEKSILYIVTRN
jgi:SAM-dependent methyltransferase